jgi:pimeloyl-ACP methyl ester carboxylesterase
MTTSHNPRRQFLSTTALAASALALPAAAQANAHAHANAKANPTPRTYVLVHGAWHGGWCWRHTKALLEKSGHRVFAPTLSGMGERHHLTSAAIDLNTHIRDITAVIEYEELSDVVLVGHSYGGHVTTGVSQLLPERISHLVFLDATLPVPGKAGRDFWPPEAVAQVEKNLIDGFRLPSFPPVMFDIPPTDKANTEWAQRRLTDMPYGVFKTVFPTVTDANAAKVKALRRTFVRCTASKLDGPRFGYEAARASGMQLVDLATGHNPMMTAPSTLHELLQKIA